MLTQTDLQALSLCQAPLERAVSLPPAAYATAEWQAAERDHVFARGWLGLGRSDRIAQPGDFETLEVAGRRLILIRDRDRVARVLANTCAHRGARLLEGSGSCKGIRCPFHAWLYRLDGSLAAAPRMESAEGFDLAENGLTSHRVEERFGFLFLSLDPEAPELDTWLGDFGAYHAPWQLDRLETVRKRQFGVACDWKAFVEVFNEYYHLPYVHRDSIDGVYDDPEPGDAVTGAYATQFGKTEGTGALLEGAQDNALPLIPWLTGAAAEGVRYSWLYPNMTFAAGSDALWVYECHPDGPGRVAVTQYACFPAETRELADFDARAAHYLERLDAAIAEDIPALENQQLGLASLDARQGRLNPALEPNVARFAAWYAGRMLG